MGNFPAMGKAVSERRKAAVLPTSSIVMFRRSGELLSTRSRILPKLAIPAAARVLVGPWSATRSLPGGSGGR
jgi:hypothetical protein